MCADPLRTQPVDASFFHQDNDTVITWLGMAGAMINARGTILLIDPLISLRDDSGDPVNEIGYRLSVPLPLTAREVPRADLVMYTHGDDDHIGRLTAQTLAANTQCRFLATPPVVQMLVDAGISPDRIDTAREGQEIEVGQVRIQVTPAMHDWQQEIPWKREDCCGYLLRAPEGTIWHPGDTRLIDDLFAVHDVDVLFFDIAAVESHLGPEGSAKVAASCGAKILIAYHYGTFDLPPGSFATCDPDDALPYVRDLPARFLRPDPGERLSLANLLRG